MMAAAFQGPPNPASQYLSAAAMYILELTRIDPEWSEWKETDVSAVRSAFRRNVAR